MSRSSPQLELTVPEGWRLVELDRVLAGGVPDMMIAALGDELDPETQGALRDEFRSVRTQVAIERVVLLALRFDQDRRDVMTVALHDLAGPPATVLSGLSEPSGQGSKPVGETLERVSVGDREVIVHASSEDDPGASSPWVQVVLLLSSGEGAAVTITSSAPGREEELRAAAIEVAGSLVLVPDAPVRA